MTTGKSKEEIIVKRFVERVLSGSKLRKKATKGTFKSVF